MEFGFYQIKASDRGTAVLFSGAVLGVQLDCFRLGNSEKLV